MKYQTDSFLYISSLIMLIAWSIAAVLLLLMLVIVKNKKLTLYSTAIIATSSSIGFFIFIVISIDNHKKFHRDAIGGCMYDIYLSYALFFVMEYTYYIVSAERRKLHKPSVLQTKIEKAVQSILPSTVFFICVTIPMMMITLYSPERTSIYVNVNFAASFAFCTILLFYTSIRRIISVGQMAHNDKASHYNTMLLFAKLVLGITLILLLIIQILISFALDIRLMSDIILIASSLGGILPFSAWIWHEFNRQLRTQRRNSISSSQMKKSKSTTNQPVTVKIEAFSVVPVKKNALLSNDEKKEEE